MAKNVKQDGKKKVDAIVEQKDSTFPSGIRVSKRFAALSKLIIRDLNNNTSSPSFYLYSKDEIQTYISNPYRYEAQLRNAVVYMYGASPHFRRLIQYFTGLSDLSFVISPTKIDPNKTKATALNKNYRKVLNIMSAFNVKTQFPKIINVCLREDTFYGTMWVSDDSIIIQQLPSAYCSITTIENNVMNVTFNFAYFDSRSDMLDYYPDEFRRKYTQYRNDRTNKWIELDSPTSFAIKCNNDILEYSMPPFIGILREVYDLEDYKQLKKSRTALENYAMLAMKLPMDDDGNWLLDKDRATEFWQNLDDVLPEEVGSVLSPMEIKKIDFEKSNTGDTNTIADAEQNLFFAAGVQSLLFNNEKASANSLSLSVKVDQSITYGIVKSIEDMVNRYVQSQAFGRNFKVTFLDCSPFNRKEVGDQYLKAAQYGLPTVMMYAASQGLGQCEFDSMAFLENDMLDLKSKLKPLQSSATQSSSADTESSDAGGRPRLGIDELSDSGEQTREDEA